MLHILLQDSNGNFNSSLEQQCVPTLWKLANLAPIPKELPLSNCDQLRPISLTNIIMRLFEKLAFNLEDPESNLLIKFPDDLTVSAPVKTTGDSAASEVRNINRMTLNMSKTWEMVVRGRTTKPLPLQLDGIEHKNWLKLLGMAFQDDPCCWDLQVDTLLSYVHP